MNVLETWVYWVAYGHFIDLTMISQSSEVRGSASTVTAFCMSWIKPIST